RSVDIGPVKLDLELAQTWAPCLFIFILLYMLATFALNALSDWKRIDYLTRKFAKPLREEAHRLEHEQEQLIQRVGDIQRTSNDDLIKWIERSRTATAEEFENLANTRRAEAEARNDQLAAILQIMASNTKKTQGLTALLNPIRLIRRWRLIVEVIFPIVLG